MPASSKRHRAGRRIVEDSSSEDETEAPEPAKEAPEPTSRKGKGKKDKAQRTAEPSGRSKRQNDKAGKSSSKRRKLKKVSKGEEEVCFVCFERGNLIFCDHPACPKAYHPACTNHEEEFFKSMDEWSCRRHVCLKCEKAPQFMCYTCTHALCKSCVKKEGFYCVRGDEGLCEDCMKLVMCIENSGHENKGKAPADHVDENSWNYLFNCYWLDLKGKLALTLGELTKARNPWKESGASSQNAKSSDELHDVWDCPGLGHIDATNSTGSKMKKRFRFSNEKGKGKESGGFAGTSEPEAIEWASEELMRFVEHMKDGNTSVLSLADVLLLLLKYINRNNLRDPRKRSQVICDPLLVSLFKKERVGHAEMLKLLDSHFLVKDSDAKLESDRSNYSMPKTNSARKRKMPKVIYEIKPQTNLDDFAAIDFHNISLIYLRRSLMEDLLDDMEIFHDKVVGSFVRTRILGTDPKKDMHQLVQVVGTSRAEETYTTGKKTTDVMLEILNLDNTDFVAVDTISDHEFTEEECNRLCQDIKSGLISRFTVGEILEKAIDLHAVRFNNWLETELLLLGRIRDRANEKGRRKELKDSLDKIQLLNSPEEHSRRLAELPEVHADPSMDPDYNTGKGQGNQDDKGLRKGKDLASPRKSGSAFSNGWKTQTKGECATSSGLSTGMGVSSNDSETDKIWHYKDPSGKIQGPFSMSQFRKWSKGGYFPADLRIWKTSEGEEDSMLLTDALDGNSQTNPLNWDPFESFSQPKEDQEGGWGGASSSKNPDKQPKDSVWESNWNAAGGPNDGNDEGWGTKSPGWTTEKTQAVSSMGGGAGWESNDSHAWSSQPEHDSSKPTSPFSRSLPDTPTKVDLAFGSNGATSCDLGVTAPDTGGSTKISQGAASDQSPSLTAIVHERIDGDVSADKLPAGESHQSNSRNEDNLTMSLDNQASDIANNLVDGWGTMPMKDPNDGLVETPKKSDKDWGSAEGDGCMNWGSSARDKTKVGCGSAAHLETTAEGNAKTGWRKASHGTSVQVNTAWEAAMQVSAGKSSAGVELDATREANTDAGWEKRTERKTDTVWEKPTEGETNTNAGWEKGTERNTDTVWEKPTEGETNTGWGEAAQGKTSNVDSGTTVWSTSTHNDKNTGEGARIDGHINVDSGTAKWGASMHDDRSRGRATGDKTTDSGKAKWEPSTKGNVDDEWGRPVGGNANPGSGPDAWGTMQEVVNAGSGASAWESAGGDTKTGLVTWGTTPEGNANSDWNKSSGNSGSQVNSDKAAWGASTQGNSRSWESAAEGNTGWGTTPKGNTDSDWNKSNGNSGSWGSSQKATWGSSQQGHSGRGWGSAAEGNKNAGWGTGGQGDANAGWGAASEGNRDSDWNKSSGNSGSWGSSQKQTGGRFSGQEGHRRLQDGESWCGGERPSWNRQSSGRDGNSPRMPPRGGQRVCKFHESGHCKKGASCNFLHT